MENQDTTTPATPAYLVISDGSVQITFAGTPTLNGAPVASVTMREPTVRDQLAMEKASGVPAERELAMMASLLQVSPVDLQGLTLRNYRRIQDGFATFLD